MPTAERACVPITGRARAGHGEIAGADVHQRKDAARHSVPRFRSAGEAAKPRDASFSCRAGLRRAARSMTRVQW